jgi:hypothetical protein
VFAATPAGVDVHSPDHILGSALRSDPRLLAVTPAGVTRLAKQEAPPEEPEEPRNPRNQGYFAGSTTTSS